MKLWKLIDGASIYLKIQCKYIKPNGNTNIKKHGKKKKYQVFNLFLHYRDINLNYLRKRRRHWKLVSPFSKGWNSISNFVPLSPSILHADTRNFITPHNKTTNKYTQSTVSTRRENNETSASDDDGWNIESYESIFSSS